MKLERHERMYAAWHNASFQRSKRMPSLKTVLGEKTDKPFRSNDQFLAMMRQARREGVGIKIRKVG